MTSGGSISVSELILREEAEVTTGPFGTQFKASEYVESGVPMLNVRNLGFGDIRMNSLEFLSDETAARLLKHQLAPGDIVFGRKGAVERHAFISSREDGWVQGSDCLRLRLDSLLLVPRYVSYFLLTEFHKEWMKNHCSGATTMASLNQDIVGRIEIPLAPISHQRKIVEVLSAYDDLIENNARRIEILEEMAQAIYREWFVEFRYPGHEDAALVDSELGPIPEGWECVEFGDVAEITRSNIDPGKFPDETFAHFSLPAFDNNRSQSLDMGSEIKSLKFLITEPCVLYSKLNPRIPRVWFIDSVPDSRAVASSEFLVITPRLPWTCSMVYSICLSESFAGRVVGLAAGTSTSHQRVKPADLLRIHVPLGPAKLMSEFDNTVGPMLKLIGQLREQCRNLRETRNMLLPKLISGEIDVSELDIESVGSSA